MSRGSRRFWARLAGWVSNSPSLRIDRWIVGATGFSFINHCYARAGGFIPRPCLLLTTRHHKSGEPRTVVLPYRRDGDRWLVVGSHGGAPTDAIWAKNLRVHTEVEMQVDRRRLPVTVVEATGAEREHVWQVVTDDGAYLHYEKIAHPRIIPVFVLAERAS